MKIVILLLAILLQSLVLMVAWDYVVPTLLGLPAIDFPQAVALNCAASIIFGHNSRSDQ